MSHVHDTPDPADPPAWTRFVRRLQSWRPPVALASAQSAREIWDRADALYAEAVQLSHIPGAEQQAERKAAAAAAEYRRLLKTDDSQAARRKLAQALWRRSMLLYARGKPHDALAPGREAVALARQVMESTPRDDPEFDVIVGELGIVMNDLSQVALTAGLPDEGTRAMLDVLDICERSNGPAARRAMGTALHNMTVQMLSIVVHRLQNGQDARLDLQKAIVNAMGVVALRRTLIKDAEPATHWELASSLSLLGRALCLSGQGQEGVQALVEGYMVLLPLAGPAADALRKRLLDEIKAAKNAYPNVTININLTQGRQ